MAAKPNTMTILRMNHYPEWVKNCHRIASLGLADSYSDRVGQRSMVKIAITPEDREQYCELRDINTVWMSYE